MSNQPRGHMRIEKVIRIVTVFIALMSVGIGIATVVFFPAINCTTSIPPLIALAGCLRFWHKRYPTTTKHQ